MIQNKAILEKLKEKTANDDVMNEFIVAILENESEGKQYTKFFQGEIEKGIDKRKQIGGENSEI